MIFRTKFMPNTDVWNRILAKIKGNILEDRILAFSPDDPSMSYDRNPVFGVREVGRLLDQSPAEAGDRCSTRPW